MMAESQSGGDLVIRSLQGGLNDTDVDMAIRDDQCVVATNVEFVSSPLGARRNGCVAISLVGSSLATKDTIVLLYRHLPTGDETAAQLWAVAATLDGVSGAVVQFKTTAWQAAPALTDALDITTAGLVNHAMASLHGKLFYAYRSSVARLHVYDGTSIRRTGVAQPAAPTTAETGVAGTYSGTRYFRVRYIETSGGTILRRSEPSPSVTVTPSGTKTGTVITKGATLSEGETNWELEASTDNAVFYRVSTAPVGTTTQTDTVAYSVGYAAAGTLSEAIGNYALIPAGRFLVTDDDRLLWAGSTGTDGKNGSQVGWTPVTNDPGVGNDERVPTATNNTLQLDPLDGGDLTDFTRASQGVLYAFKWKRIYRLVRNYIGASNAYSSRTLSTTQGALPGSVQNGFDERGRPCIWFLDPAVGISRIGVDGITAHHDLATTWAATNLSASTVVARSIFYPDRKQMWWWVAQSGSNTPTTMIKLQVDLVTPGRDGLTGGISLATGDLAQAYAACLFSDNIDAGVARSRTLRPFVGLTTPHRIVRADTGTTDDGTAYLATIQTKPFLVTGLLNKFGVRSTALLAKADAAATVTLTLTRDFGLETAAATVALAATGAETSVSVLSDDLSLSECRTIQVTFADPSPATGQWGLRRFEMSPRREEQR